MHWHRLKSDCAAPIISSLLLLMTANAGAQDTASLLETHAANKQRVLERIEQLPRLTVTMQFHRDVREVWRHVLIDGPYAGVSKDLFFRGIAQSSLDGPLHEAVESLWRTHDKLFGPGQFSDLMIRYAGDPAFKAFGRHMTLPEALTEVMGLKHAEVQAFQTIFETGQNTRGYTHKLESHGQATEFIYAITDIVYGVILPSELEFDPNRVTANPQKVQMFYVRAGEVIALYPHVLHSGSLSVEPDRSFSVVIYKQPVPENDSPMSDLPLVGELFRERPVQLPEQWQQRQDWLKIVGADKYYLTLAELHTDDLKTNRGFIADKRPIRLPTWRQQ